VNFFFEKETFVMNLKAALKSGSMWRLAAELHACFIVFLLQQSTGWLAVRGGVTRKRISFSFHHPLR
jgi:hypothetical protein